MEKRIDSLQSLRAIAFILIFLSHVEIISTGPIAVSVFLVMSGFCMTYSYLDKPNRLPEACFQSSLFFVFCKLKKLYPLHILTLLFVSCALLLSGNNSESPNGILQVSYFFINALLLQSWIPVREGYYSFNAVSWYLSTSAFSYFLFPWVFRVVQTHEKKKVAGLISITGFIMVLIAVILGVGLRHGWWSNDFVKWAVYISPLYRAGDFIIGLCVGYIYKTSKSTKGTGLYSSIEVITLLVIACFVALYDKGIMRANNWMLTLIWVPMTAMIVFLGARHKGVISKLLNRCKPLIWIGNISGEAFLIHHICIKASERFFSNKVIIFVVAFFCTLIATMAWRFAYGRIMSARKAS